MYHYITKLLKYSVVFLSYLCGSYFSLIFLLIPNEFTVECGRNENQFYLKLIWIIAGKGLWQKNQFMQVVTLYATKGTIIYELSGKQKMLHVDGSKIDY